MPTGRRFHVLVAGVLVFTAVLAGGRSARAATTTTGGGAFEGTMTMAYPCSTCGTGTITATAAMSLIGVSQGGSAYTATWPDPRTTPPGTVPTNFTSNGMTVTNECIVTAPVPPLLGGGGAGFTLSGGLLVINGAAWDNATLTGTITWQWDGPTVGVVTLTGATITGGSGPGVIAVTLDLDNMVVGNGVMAFTWNVPMGNCAVQNASQTALIQAAVEQPA
jgi:hypothetical protein